MTKALGPFIVSLPLSRAQRQLIKDAAALRNMSVRNWLTAIAVEVASATVSGGSVVATQGSGVRFVDEDGVVYREPVTP